MPLGQVFFLLVRRLFSVSVIPSVLHTHRHVTCYSYQQDKREKTER